MVLYGLPSVFSSTYSVQLWFYSGPLFTKRTDILLQDLAKSRSHEIQLPQSDVTLLQLGGLHFSMTLEAMPAGVLGSWKVQPCWTVFLREARLNATHRWVFQ